MVGARPVDAILGVLPNGVDLVGGPLPQSLDLRGVAAGPEGRVKKIRNSRDHGVAIIVLFAMSRCLADVGQ